MRAVFVCSSKNVTQYSYTKILKFMCRCSILVTIISGGEAMTGVRYKIPMLSAKAILAYAKPVGEDIYSFNLNKA